MKAAVRSVTAADSRNADKGDEPITADTHVFIAGIVGRLISGKSIATLYDYAQAKHIMIRPAPTVSSMTEFDVRHRNYLPGYYSGSRYQYACGDGGIMHLSIKGTSFVGRFIKTSAYFVGHVRGDTIYLFDHEESVHVNYRISGCAIENNDATGI